MWKLAQERKKRWEFLLVLPGHVPRQGTYVTQFLSLPQMGTAPSMFPSLLEDVPSMQNPCCRPSAWRGLGPSPLQVTLLPHTGSLLWRVSHVQSSWPGEVRMGSMAKLGKKRLPTWNLGSPTHPTHLGFVFHGHCQLYPLSRAKSTSVVFHYLIFEHLSGCSRSKCAP